MAYRETESRKAHKGEQREHVLACAEQLVREGGFAALSMRGLASRSGISVGGLYRYFHNKRFLAAQVFRRATEREVAAVAVAVTEGADVHERLSHAVQQFVRRAQAAPKLAWALIAEPVAPEVDAERLRYRAAYSRLYRRMLEKGVASGELPPQSTSLSAAALVGAIAEALVGPLAEPLGDDTLADNLSEFALRAVGAPRRRARPPSS